MFVRMYDDRLEYGDEGIVPRDVPPPTQPYADFVPADWFPNTRSPWHVLTWAQLGTREANDLSRQLANQTTPVWFCNADLDGTMGEGSIFKGRLAYDRPGSVWNLADTYEATNVEAEGLIRNGVTHGAGARAWVNLCLTYTHEGRDAEEWLKRHGWTGWTIRAAVFAWFMQQRDIRHIPHLQSLGFAIDTAERISDDMVEAYHGIPSPQLSFAEKLGAQFIENVTIAAKVALDTPQPVTIDVGGDFKLTFENVRLTPQVAGLRITLPTGDVLFYRDAGLDPETGDVARIRGDGSTRRIPQRTIARHIIERTADSLNWLAQARRKCYVPEHPATKGFFDWYYPDTV